MAITTRIEWAIDHNEVVILDGEREVARLSLDEWVKLDAVAYAVDEAIAAHSDLERVAPGP